MNARMSLSSVFSMLVAVCLASFAAGCAVPPVGDGEDAGDIASLDDAPDLGAEAYGIEITEPTPSYSCNSLGCTCTGDEDCNDMFESGLCGPIATCNEDTGTCTCMRLGGKLAK